MRAIRILAIHGLIKRCQGPGALQNDSLPLIVKPVMLLEDMSGNQDKTSIFGSLACQLWNGRVGSSRIRKGIPGDKDKLGRWGSSSIFLLNFVPNDFDVVGAIP